MRCWMPAGPLPWFSRAWPAATAQQGTGSVTHQGPAVDPVTLALVYVTAKPE